MDGINPSELRILSSAHYDSKSIATYSESGIEIWRIGDSVATSEFKLDSKPWSASDVTWKDDDTIVFVKHGWLGAEMLEDIGLSCIKYDGQKWNLIEGDKETLPSGC
jgi:hypothetical protein